MRHEQVIEPQTLAAEVEYRAVLNVKSVWKVVRDSRCRWLCGEFRGRNEAFWGRSGSEIRDAVRRSVVDFGGFERSGRGGGGGWFRDDVAVVLSAFPLVPRVDMPVDTAERDGQGYERFQSSVHGGCDNSSALLTAPYTREKLLTSLMSIRYVIHQHNGLALVQRIAGARGESIRSMRWVDRALREDVNDGHSGGPDAQKSTQHRSSTLTKSLRAQAGVAIVNDQVGVDVLSCNLVHAAAADTSSASPLRFCTPHSPAISSVGQHVELLLLRQPIPNRAKDGHSVVQQLVGELQRDLKGSYHQTVLSLLLSIAYPLVAALLDLVQSHLDFVRFLERIFRS